MDLSIIKDVVISYSPVLAAVGSCVLTVKKVKESASGIVSNLKTKVKSQDVTIEGIKTTLVQTSADFGVLMGKTNECVESVKNVKNQVETTLNETNNTMNALLNEYKGQVEDLTTTVKQLIAQNQTLVAQNETLMDELRKVN